jgi:hypothetical protein
MNKCSSLFFPAVSDGEKNSLSVFNLEGFSGKSNICDYGRSLVNN